MVKIAIKVIPKASKNEVVGWKDDVLNVRLTAVPEKGKANADLIRLLSKYFKVPKSAITIVKGETSRNKLIDLKK
jgi:uncharacterized protein